MTIAFDSLYSALLVLEHKSNSFNGVGIVKKHPDVAGILQTILPAFGPAHTEPKSSKHSSGRRKILKGNIKLLLIRYCIASLTDDEVKAAVDFLVVGSDGWGDAE